MTNNKNNEPPTRGIKYWGLVGYFNIRSFIKAHI